MIYHRKGEKLLKKNSATVSRADRVWYRQWWQSRIDNSRRRLEKMGEETPMVLRVALTKAIQEDCEYAKRYGCV